MIEIICFAMGFVLGSMVVRMRVSKLLKQVSERNDPTSEQATEDADTIIKLTKKHVELEAQLEKLREAAKAVVDKANKGECTAATIITMEEVLDTLLEHGDE